MNTTALQEYFWGGTEPYVPTTLEYYLFIISNITWYSIAFVYYGYIRKRTDRWLPTYSYMVKESPIYYMHFIMWFLGVIMRMTCIAFRQRGIGLCILMPFLTVSWLGTSLHPIKTDGLDYSRDNQIHIYFASSMFFFFYILIGFFCSNYLLFQLKFALLIMSTFVQWKNYTLFSIMEHICVHHVCVYSYPLI